MNCQVNRLLLLLFAFVTLLQRYNCTPPEKQKLEESADSPVVTTHSGGVKGTILESRLGKSFYAFRGIPYAKAPLGKLRFKAPVAIEAWNETFDATEDGPRCPQPIPFDELDDISEDCLRLNIYTPELPKPLKTVKKPVILYIHPGGFYSVSGQSKNFAGPQSFMDRNIVLVTINYRLGSLGFLATNSPDAPGNAGLKDQVLALKWVKANILKFGGDPNMITLLGYSAGAMSVSLHLVSPMSRGLFHRAIVMSGAVTAQWKIPGHQIDLAKKQARAVNCPETPIHYMMDCLRHVPEFALGISLNKMFDFLGNPILLWKPVIEPDFGQERFLTNDPTELFQAGKFMRIPIIAGITKDEFAGPAVYICENETLNDIMNRDWERLAPICFLYETGTEKSYNVSQTLKEECIGEKLNGLKSISGLNQLFADGVIGFGVDRFVQLVSKYTKTYYYKFSYQGRYSHLYFPDDKPYGVVHHDDLLYLFVAPKVAPMFTKDDPEDIMVERMTRMWSNFALIGDPNGPLDPILKKIKWKPVNILTPQQKIYLEINDVMSMKDDLYADRYKVWNKLFPLRQLTLPDIIRLSLPTLLPQSTLSPFPASG